MLQVSSCDIEKVAAGAAPDTAADNYAFRTPNTPTSRFRSDRHLNEKSFFRKVKSSPRVSKYVDSITKEEIDNINLLLAEFFIGINLAFSAVESDYFKRFVQKLRPSYKPPSRKTSSTTLLDKVYDNHIKLKTPMDKESVLLIDGWKNSSANTKNVVCMIHNIGDQQYFLDSWDLTGVSENSENLTKVVNEASELAKDKYDTDVYAVISDNASLMVKMGKTVGLWHHTCDSHSGNLLAKDLVNDEISGNITTVMKQFKQPDLEKELLTCGGLKVILVADTRWCSYRDHFRRFLHNLKPMRKIVVDGKYSVKKDVKKLLFDEELEAKVRAFVKVFEPVCLLINKCQATECNIADSTEEWLKLKEPEGCEEFKDFYDFRRKKALGTYGLTANYLHPEY